MVSTERICYSCDDPLSLYQCKTCQLSTNEKTNQIYHNCETLSRSEVIYSCGLCGFTCYSFLWIFVHRLKHEHRNNRKTKYKLKRQSTGIIRKKLIYCDQCNYIAKCNWEMKTHKTCKHTPDDEINWFKCEKCNNKFKFQHYLNSHIRHVHLKQWLNCDICNFRSILYKDLSKHKAAKHSTPDQKNRCHPCKLKFTDDETLRIHRVKTHTKRMIFQCKDCVFCTISKKLLEKHLKQKHGLLHCKNCNYTANDLCSFRQHMKDDHPLLEKQWKCTECTFTTTRKKSLNEHAKFKHTPNDQLTWFSCEMCKYKSKRRGGLKIHMVALHSSGNSFKCTDCSYTTAFRNRLRQHIARKHPTDDACK